MKRFGTEWRQRRGFKIQNSKLPKLLKLLTLTRVTLLLLLPPHSTSTMSFTDEWSPPANASQAQDSTTDSRSPSKRASRHNRISNEIEHFSYTRRTTGGDTTEYRVGDAVIVDDTVKLKQKFLHPPLYQIEPQTKTKSRGKGKKKVEVVPAEDYEGWKHEDGLAAGEKVAVITRLFEDVRGVKMALVRWFARPGAVWGPEGPQDDEVGCKTLPASVFLFSHFSSSVPRLSHCEADSSSPTCTVRALLHIRLFTSD